MVSEAHRPWEDGVAQIADFIRRHRLEVPAGLFLEMHRPLRGVGHALGTISGPLLGALVGTSRAQALQQILDSSDAYEALIHAVNADSGKEGSSRGA